MNILRECLLNLLVNQVTSQEWGLGGGNADDANSPAEPSVLRGKVKSAMVRASS